MKGAVQAASLYGSRSNYRILDVGLFLLLGYHCGNFLHELHSTEFIVNSYLGLVRHDARCQNSRAFHYFGLCHNASPFQGYGNMHYSKFQVSTDIRNTRKSGGNLVNVECLTLISGISSLIAAFFSWVTISTQEWKWYIPTVLFAAVSLGSSVIAFSLG